MAASRKDQSLFILNTGDGKGKTTAAFGQAMRVAGNGGRVCIIQFIKGNWQTGEAKAVKFFGECMEIHVLGSGFTWEADDLEDVQKEGRHAWSFACEKLVSDNYDLIVLDELTYLVSYGIVSEDEVLTAINERSARTNVVITGRGATAGLIRQADLVTEMREVKHHFQSGIGARKNIEF